MSKSILIIDDEEFFGKKLKEDLSEEGYHVIVALTGKEGIGIAREETPDLILLDLKLPDADGLDILKNINSIEPFPQTIMMTGHGNIETAVSALKIGAYDFIEKPFHLDELKITIRNALDSIGLKKSIRKRVDKEKREFGFSSLIGGSEAVKRNVDLFEKLVATDAKTILITGESGTGKGLAAKILHFNGVRADKPFIELNCAAIPETLLESELFGYEAGAFTDAKKMKTGIFEDADGGTMFLDEIGDMSLALQAKLVKGIEERTFRRIGGKRDIKVDMRVIAATNRNLKELVAENRFREDLYHRLNVIIIEMPKLRERREDIPHLVKHFLNYFNNELHKNITFVPEEVIEKFMRYDWPGNVRELRSTIERAVLLSEGESLNPKYIQLEEEVKGLTIDNEGTKLSLEINLNEVSLESIEQEIIRKSLELNEWNQTKTAEMLRLTRQQLRNRMIKMGLLN